MTYTAGIVVIIVGVILAVLVMKLLSGLVKTAATLLLIILVVGGASIAVIYKDYQTLQNGLESNAVLDVTYKNETVLALNITRDSDGVEPVENPGNVSLRLRVKHSAFQNATYNLPGLDLSYAKVTDILKATTLEEASEPFTPTEEEVILTGYEDVDTFKRDVMLVGVTSQLQEGSQRFLLEGIKNGEITVEPELLMFTFMSYVPERIIDSAARDINGTA